MGNLERVHNNGSSRHALSFNKYFRAIEMNLSKNDHKTDKSKSTHPEIKANFLLKLYITKFVKGFKGFITHG